MRTTITLTKAVLHRAKQSAEREGKTLSQYIEETLLETFENRKKTAARKPFRLVTFGGKGLQPGMRWETLAADLDALDGGHSIP